MRMSWLQGFGVMHIVTCWQNVAHRTNQLPVRRKATDMWQLQEIRA